MLQILRSLELLLRTLEFLGELLALSPEFVELLLRTLESFPSS